MTVDSSFFKSDCVSVSKKVTWKPRRAPILGVLKFLGLILILPILWVMWSFDNTGF